jgi:hypothetical protein
MRNGSVDAVTGETASPGVLTSAFPRTLTRDRLTDVPALLPPPVSEEHTVLPGAWPRSTSARLSFTP